MVSRHYNKEFVEEFINLYKEHPCLWKIKSYEYHDKAKRTIAYQALINKLQEVEPNATKDMVIKKINAMRTSFRREFKKVQASMALSTAPDEQYMPNLWYYNLLMFTVDQEFAYYFNSNGQEDEKLLMSSFDDDNQDDGQTLDAVEVKLPMRIKKEISDENYTLPGLKPISQAKETENQQVEPPTNVIFPHNVPLRKGPERRKRCTQEDVFHLPRKSIRETLEAEFENVGKNVATKLGLMNEQQQIIAEKLISDVLFHGRMDRLTPESSIQLNNYLQPQNLTTGDKHYIY